MHRYANPARFLRIAAKVLPWTTGLMVLCLVVGLFQALVTSPADYQQGETVRIMYVHVPAAWMSLFAYMVMAGGSASFLIWRHPLGDLIAKAAAPVGAMFTAVCLITGSLWGEPMWGTWWVWDARLTSMLVLFFLYLGYIALAGSFDDPARGARSAAILALVGVVNVPIIKFSVDWWNTLHQPASVSRLDAPAIDPSMLTPLLVMAVGFMAYFFTVLLMRVRSEFLAAKIRAARFARAAG